MNSMKNMKDDIDDIGDESEEMMVANRLLYKMPQPLSVKINKTFKREYALRNSYTPGQVMTWTFNTGTDYIDPSNCMLTFSVTPETTTGPTNGDAIGFGTGIGATALFRTVRVISKNGTELQRVNNCHMLTKIWTNYNKNVTADSALENAGFGRQSTRAAGAFPALNVSIPLSLFIPMFRPVNHNFMPAGLASGLRIEITLESASRSLQLVSAGGTVVTYTINNPVILCESSTLSDPVQALLLENSAKTGLEYTYPSYHDTEIALGTNTAINETVQKAVSQATRVFTTVYDTSGANNVNDELRDGFFSIPSSEFTNYQYRVGSNYYPQQPVDSVTEALYVANSTFDRNRDVYRGTSQIALADFQTLGDFIMAVPLESDSRLNLSGLNLNSSSVLNLESTLGASAGGTNRDAVIFLEYVSVSKTHINRTEVKI